MHSNDDSFNMKKAMADASFSPINLEPLKALIASGVGVETRFGNVHYTPLTYASEVGGQELVKYLLSIGANPEAVSKHGSSLHCAAIFNRGDILKLLVESGANVEVLDVHGKSPIQVAQYATAMIPLVLGGAKYPFNSFGIDESVYKAIDLKSAIVAAKVSSGGKLTAKEVTFKGSGSYMPEYEGLYQQTMASIDAHKNPELKITDGDSSGSVDSHISKFYIGFYTGNFVVSPAINYLNDGVKGINAEKPLFDYYADKMNHNTIAKSVVFSFVFAALPNYLGGANKIITAKIVSDSCVSGIDLSPEYVSSLILHLASSIASFSTIGFVQQTEFYDNNPLLAGVIGVTASEVVSLCYNTVNMMQNYMAGESSSLVSEAE